MEAGRCWHTPRRRDCSCEMSRSGRGAAAAFIKSYYGRAFFILQFFFSKIIFARYRPPCNRTAAGVTMFNITRCTGGVDGEVSRCTRARAEPKQINYIITKLYYNYCIRKKKNPMIISSLRRLTSLPLST